jgi:hypothetical protein
MLSICFFVMYAALLCFVLLRLTAVRIQTGLDGKKGISGRKKKVLKSGDIYLISATKSGLWSHWFMLLLDAKFRLTVAFHSLEVRCYRSTVAIRHALLGRLCRLYGYGSTENGSQSHVSCDGHLRKCILGCFEPECSIRYPFYRVLTG